MRHADIQKLNEISDLSLAYELSHLGFDDLCCLLDHFRHGTINRYIFDNVIRFASFFDCTIVSEKSNPATRNHGLRIFGKHQGACKVRHQFTGDDFTEVSQFEYFFEAQPLWQTSHFPEG